MKMFMKLESTTYMCIQDDYYCYRLDSETRGWERKMENKQLKT